MPSVEIAHVRTQNVNIIVVPVSRSFPLGTPTSQDRTLNDIMAAARSAGLDGAVTLVWEDNQRRFNFRAPRNQHAFYRSIDMRWVERNLNARLSW